MSREDYTFYVYLYQVTQPGSKHLYNAKLKEDWATISGPHALKQELLTISMRDPWERKKRRLDVTIYAA